MFVLTQEEIICCHGITYNVTKDELIDLWEEPNRFCTYDVDIDELSQLEQEKKKVKVMRKFMETPPGTDGYVYKTLKGIYEDWELYEYEVKINGPNITIKSTKVEHLSYLHDHKWPPSEGPTDSDIINPDKITKIVEHKKNMDDYEFYKMIEYRKCMLEKRGSKTIKGDDFWMESYLRDQEEEKAMIELNKAKETISHLKKQIKDLKK